MEWQDNWKEKDKLGGSIISTLGAMSPGITSLIDGYNTDVSNIENQLDLDIKRLKAGWDGVSADSMDDLMSQQASYRNIDTAYNAKNKYNVPSTGDIWSNALMNSMTSAASSASLGPWASAAIGIGNLAGSLIGGYKKRNTMNDAINEADNTYAAEANRQNAYRQASFQTAADKLATKDNRMLMTQMSTHGYGGPLGISLLPVGGAIDYMQNEELLTSLNDGMNKNGNKKVPMPVFAFGGALGGYGGNWDSGLTYIGSGGSHEQNPFGGVPAGIDEDGEENKVEEGEWIWKDQDYVFSARLHVPEDDYEALGLRKRKEGYTYAQAAEIGQKESSERPNDAISKKGKEAFLTKLMQSQEKVREEKMIEEQYNEQMKNIAAYAAEGGNIFRKKKKGKYAVEGSPAERYTGLGQILNSMNPYTAPMNAARNVNEYQKSLDASNDLHRYASYVTYPLMIMGAPTETEALFQDVLLGNNYAGAFAGQMLPLLEDMHTSISKDSEKKKNNESKVSNIGERRVGIEYAEGGGLSRSKDYGSKKKPYPKVKSKDFAGKDRSYPIPTKADAIDALRLAGLHHRPDVKAKVYKKYPELKHALGGHLFWPGGLKNSPYLIASNELGFKYKGLDTTYNAATGTTNTNNNGQRDPLPTSGWQTGLRYAPILGPMLAIGHSLFNKPDYEYANALSDLAKSYKSQLHYNITPEYLGDYLAYNPFDRLFYANELGAQQAANRSAIMNTGNANRGATMMALLGSGYNDNISQGRLFREGEEYNLAQRQKVAEFNRATGQYNSQARLNTDIAKMSERNKGLATALGLESKALKMKQAEDAAYWSGLMSNLSNTFQSMGDVGNEAEQRYWLNALINSGILGTPNESMLDIAYGKKLTERNLQPIEEN